MRFRPRPPPRQPAHGYELKQALEQRFDGVPAAAERRPGLHDARPARARRARRRRRDRPERPPEQARLRADRRRPRAAREWLETPATGARLKDEFFMKLVLAGADGIADPQVLIDRQRREYLQALRDLDRTPRTAPTTAGPPADRRRRAPPRSRPQVARALRAAARRRRTHDSRPQGRGPREDLPRRRRRRAAPCAASTSRSSRASSSRSWARAAAASRRCCTCSAGSTGRRPATIELDGRGSTSSRDAAGARCAAASSASSSSAST